MEIVSSKAEMIFRKDYNGKPSYSLGLSKKDKDGKYVNGFIKVNFRKGVDLDNKTKIKIKNAWLDFYKNDDKTIPTLFIDDYEIAEESKEQPKKEESNPFEEFGDSIKTEFDVGEQIKIEDEDLPF